MDVDNLVSAYSFGIMLGVMVIFLASFVRAIPDLLNRITNAGDSTFEF